MYDERVVGVDGGHPDAEAVAVRGEGGRLGDQPQNLLGADVGVEDFLGLGVVGGEGGDPRHEHPHRVGVVVEPLHEPLADVVVQERVVDDVEGPVVELGLRRQLPVQEQVGDLEVRRVLRQLLDRVAAVAQDAGVAVQEGHTRRARRRGQERGVVHAQVGVQLPQRGRWEHPVLDGHGDLLAGPVVDDGDGVGHCSVPFLTPCGASSPSRRIMPAPRLHSPRREWRVRRVCQSGALSCLRGRRSSRLEDSRSSARAISRLVSAGSMTAST